MSTKHAKSTKKVPRTALRFTGGACEFAAADADGRIPVRLVARSKQAIEHPYWGTVAHDLSGMRPAGDSIPLDYCHDPGEVLGYGDQFDAADPDGYVVRGALVPFAAEDRCTEVIHKSAAGVPYQASIFFDPCDMVCEDVPANRQVQVNGFTLAGPATVIRQCTLRGVALCPYGADRNTSVELSAAGGDVQVTILSQEPSPMPDETKPAAAEEPVTTALQAAAPPEAPAAPAPEKPAAELAAAPVTPPAVQKTGPDFLAAFGDRGGVWFAQGKTWDEAQALHVESLKTELAAAQQKLAAVAGQFGEATPLSGIPAKEPGDAGAPIQGNRYGSEGFARFAGNIVMPKPSAN